MRIFGCLFAIPILALWIWVFELLFNAVVGGVFHGPVITYWQSALVWIFLVVIARIFGAGSKK